MGPPAAAGEHRTGVDGVSGRRGRRDNGLDASLWHPLRDVDPRVGEHLLDVLREEGIAAYLAPSTDDGPYTRTQFLPSPPTDRLFVDRARRVEARTVVDTHGDDHPPVATTRARRDASKDAAADTAATDAEFARIVAGWEAESGPTPPVVEQPRDDPPPPPAEPDVLDRPDEHFEPPAPPPLPVLAPASLYALLLIAAGALCIIAPGTIGLSLDVGIVLGVLGVVGGVAVLVSRMRDRSDDDGDGAVV